MSSIAGPPLRSDARRRRRFSLDVASAAMLFPGATAFQGDDIARERIKSPRPVRELPCTVTAADRYAACERVDRHLANDSVIAPAKASFERALVGVSDQTPRAEKLDRAQLSDASKERRAYSANLGGALVGLTAKIRLSFAPEPPRTSGKR